MNRLRNVSDKKIRETSVDFIRFLFKKIDWNNRLIGISGARGAGKTTLILQYLKITYQFSEEAIYLELDDFYFAENSLYSFAEQFEKEGGKILLLDEVHKYKNWSHDLKMIYDNLVSLKVIFTSSSALELYKGSHDLSRRLVSYNLPGLSLREFASFKYNYELPNLSLDQLLTNSREIGMNLPSEIKPIKLYKEYIQKGYYPFFKENENLYHDKLLNVLNVILENDLPIIFNIDFQSVIKLKKLISIVARLVPYKPNVKKLAEQIGVTRETLLRQLFYLEKAQIVKWIGKDSHGINYLNKPEKLYLQNTNLIYALMEEMVNIGNVRETFFLNQLTVNHQITYPSKGDFLIDGKYIFEVGGKSKSQKQIGGLSNAFIVKDDIEFSSGNIIPIWMFGLMY
ncbi:MAG: ATP-binding protein [Bacteroidetes bacterium]|nr:ATP-binding protein [Bacteroidota bacterium]